MWCELYTGNRLVETIQTDARSMDDNQHGYKHIERAEIERGTWRAIPGDLLNEQQAVTRSYALERTHSNTPTPSRTLDHPHSITPSLSMTPTLPRCAKRRIFRRRPRRRPSGPSPNQCGHPVLSRDRPSINGNQPALYSAPPRALSSDSLVRAFPCELCVLFIVTSLYDDV